MTHHHFGPNEFSIGMFSQPEPGYTTLKNVNGWTIAEFHRILIFCTVRHFVTGHARAKMFESKNTRHRPPLVCHQTQKK